MRGVLFGVGVGVLVAGAALWFINVYDTAEGRCGRGDIGACMVLQGQAAAAADRLAEQQAAVDEQAAATQRAEDEARNRVPAGSCAVGLAGHDATVMVDGGDQSACAELASQLGEDGAAWESRAILPIGGTIVCRHRSAIVYDTGGQFYGGMACDTLTGSGA